MCIESVVVSALKRAVYSGKTTAGHFYESDPGRQTFNPSPKIPAFLTAPAEGGCLGSDSVITSVVKIAVAAAGANMVIS